MKNRTAPKRGKVKPAMLRRKPNGMERQAHTRDVPKQARRKKAGSSSVLLGAASEGRDA